MSVFLLDICRIPIQCGRLTRKAKNSKRQTEKGTGGHAMKTVRTKRRNWTDLKSQLKVLTTTSQK